MKTPRACRHCGGPHLASFCNKPEGKKSRGGRTVPPGAGFGRPSSRRSSDNRQQERIDAVLAEIRSKPPKRRRGR